MSDQTSEIEARIAEERARLRDNVEQLSERLNPSRLMDDARHAVVSAPAALASNIGERLKRDPATLLLASAGLVWLMTRKRRKEGDRERLLDDSNRSWSRGNGGYDGGIEDDEGADAHTAWDVYQERSWSTVRAADEDEMSYQRRLMDARASSLGVTREADEDEAGFKARIEKTAEKVKAGAMKFRDRLGRAARSTRRKVAGAAGNVKHKVEDVAAQAKHKVEDVASEARRKASDAASTAAHKARYAARDVVHRSADYYEQHPVTTGAIGLALGAVAGSLLHLSRIERDQLEGLVDQGLNRGADTLAGAARAVSAFANDVTASTRQ